MASNPDIDGGVQAFMDKCQEASRNRPHMITFHLSAVKQAKKRELPVREAVDQILGEYGEATTSNSS